MTAKRWKKTSIRLDPEIWRKAKFAASREPMTVGEYVEQALLAKLNEKTDKVTP